MLFWHFGIYCYLLYTFNWLQTCDPSGFLQRKIMLILMTHLKVDINIATKLGNIKGGRKKFDPRKLLDSYCSLRISDKIHNMKGFMSSLSLPVTSGVYI